MRESWVDDVLGNAPPARAEFREQLRDRVLDAWGEGGLNSDTDGQRRRRVWWLLVPAALVALLVAGLIGAAGRDRPAAPNDTPVSGSSGGTPADVVGTWIVTELDGVPLPSPLPMYHFKVGTGVGGVGVVSGFDGCNSFAANWSIDGGRLRFEDGGSTTALCLDSDGSPVPTVSPVGGRIETIDGTTTLLLENNSGTARGRRIGDLSSPASLRGTAWILGLDGPDVSLHFDDQLIADIDGVGCGRTSYTFRDGALRLDRFEGADASCVSALEGFEELRIDVAELTDAYSPSIVLVPPTGGAMRLFPRGAVETAEATATAES